MDLLKGPWCIEQIEENFNKEFNERKSQVQRLSYSFMESLLQLINANWYLHFSFSSLRPTFPNLLN